MFKKPMFYLFTIILLLGIGVTNNNDIISNNLILEKNISTYNDKIVRETKKLFTTDKKLQKTPTTVPSQIPTITKSNNKLYKVVGIVDGDTIIVDYNGKDEKVRLIGVNTPETVKPNSPIEAYGKEASEYTKKMLTDKQVELEFDVGQRDKYGRLLAYVYLDGVMFNKLLLKEGYAQVMTIQPNIKYSKEFLELQKEARENNIGLWKK